MILQANQWYAGKHLYDTARCRDSARGLSRDILGDGGRLVVMEEADFMGVTPLQPSKQPMAGTWKTNTFEKEKKLPNLKFLPSKCCFSGGVCPEPHGKRRTFFDQLLGDGEFIWNGKIRSLNFCLGLFRGQPSIFRGELLVSGRALTFCTGDDRKCQCVLGDL